MGRPTANTLMLAVAACQPAYAAESPSLGVGSQVHGADVVVALLPEAELRVGGSMGGARAWGPVSGTAWIGGTEPGPRDLVSVHLWVVRSCVVPGLD